MFALMDSNEMFMIVVLMAVGFASMFKMLMKNPAIKGAAKDAATSQAVGFLGKFVKK